MATEALITGDRSVGDVVVLYIMGIRHMGTIQAVKPVNEIVKEVTIIVQEV